jgi:hypothetical protein
VSEEMFSIAKLANKLNVSRQTIYNKIDELQLELEPYIVTTKNVKHYKIEAVTIIKNSIKSQPDKSINKSIKNTINADYNQVLEGLRDLQVNYTSNLLDQIKQLENQIREKDSQLNEKDKQFENQLKVKDSQLSEKDKQLNNKDELLRNFQILLKNEQENIKLLKEDNKKNANTIWNRLFGKQK